MREPWEQDPDAWKEEYREPSPFVLSIQRATAAFQRLSGAIALWQLLHEEPKEKEES